MRMTVLAPDLDGPVVRHRWRAFVPALTKAGFDSVRFESLRRPVSQRLALYATLTDDDVVVLVRKLLAGPELAVLRSRIWRLVYDFDDAVFLRDPSRRRAKSAVRGARFRRTVRRSDLVLAGNAILAEHASAASRRTDVRLTPTVVDTERLRPGAARDDGEVRIGWIGSAATRPFLETLQPVLDELRRADPRVRLHVMADAAPELAAATFTPWSEAAEASFLAGLDIGLGPLPDHPFTRGKCGFKLLQYAACGVPFVADDVGVQRQIAADGRVGLLATGHDEWVARLRDLVGDPELRRRLGRAARAAVEADWSLAAHAAPLAERLAHLAAVGSMHDREDIASESVASSGRGREHEAEDGAARS